MTRPAHVRAAVAKSREARLRRVERRLRAYLRYLKRHERVAFDALVGMMRRVASTKF